MQAQQCRRCNDDLRELQNLRLLLRNSSHTQPAAAFWSSSFQAIRELSAKRNARVTMPTGIHAGLATVSCVIIIMYLLAVPSTISHTPPPTPTLEPATLVSMHADLRTDLPLADSVAMRYISTAAGTNNIVSATSLEAD